MSLNVPKACVALALVVACGPEDREKPEWIIGTFSTVPGGIESAAVRRFTFEEDGGVAFEYVRNCEGIVEPWSGKWTAESDTRIRIGPTEEGEPFSDVVHTLIVERVGCGPHELYSLTDGNPTPPQPLYEGAVCLRELPSCAPSQCVGCEAIWCDEEPACDEDPAE